MAAARGRTRRYLDIWPGYVDVLSTLLMVIIFTLMVFVIAQFFLSQALSGRDRALAQLSLKVAELGDMLALEKTTNTDLRSSIAELAAQLQRSTAERDKLKQQLASTMSDRDAIAAALAAATAQAKAKAAAAASAKAEVDAKLADAYKVIDADRQKVQTLLGDIAALESLRDDLKQKLGISQTDAEAAKNMTSEAELQIELLNRQMTEMRDQLARLVTALDIADAKAKDQQTQIVDLGQRLNRALASKVEELARYRSEFFGKLKEVLGNRQDVQIVGDRFIFQSEVLFATGSADISDEGKRQLAAFADTLKNIGARIPDNIDWLLRVDGHTDKQPYHGRLGTNWELSTARAIAVVKFLIDQGIPPNRLVAAGFAEFRPLAEGDSEDVLRRNRRIELKLDQR